jgi:hypothetical protein
MEEGWYNNGTPEMLEEVEIKPGLNVPSRSPYLDFFILGILGYVFYRFKKWRILTALCSLPVVNRILTMK